jgi:hypothetical protein
MAVTDRDRNRIEYTNKSIQFDSSQPIRIDFDLNFFVSESNRTDLKMRGVVKPQNRPPVKFQLYVTQFVVLFQKHKFSSKLDRLHDSKLYPIVILPYIH